ncbi:beta/alpha barrel domain-containing protein [Legionella hackeliae]|uniref:Homocitrate synthase n=1 Tax=Legionella hackeliae TaxID=449 RepID=A0A0A8UUX7_LEGHA|nr:4-hydroxy-2-oxovalerate aldolase [Legionella hackeliae]KTD15312.1 4-hydroxy-2-oxovalerate aldolase [Legionella hackeliae]CEK11321.1 4-hydroxy-2-oxovalerate aldolase [Legionella hackeliae]STX48091.1 4-hydroxy-2-ketovalerate aldolase [Legionella hackeliae]
MSTIEVLDVSLRDGGHRTNFHFSDQELQRILKALDKSGIEYIEVGYRNGVVNPMNNIGRAGMCQKDYLNLCQSFVKHAKIAVMVHPKNVSEFDLLELKKLGVQLVRVCMLKDKFSEATTILKQIKDLSFELSLNITNMSHYEEAELDHLMQETVQYEPDMIYFADSNGSIFPEKVESIYQKYTRQYLIPFGFHAHDNLGLAQANAIAAIHSGAKYIDTSLAGMGKGIGNLKTEFFAAYLRAIKVKDYDLKQLLLASNYIRQDLGVGYEPISLDEFHRGISDPAY